MYVSALWFGSAHVMGSFLAHVTPFHQVSWQSGQQTNSTGHITSLMEEINKKKSDEKGLKRGLVTLTSNFGLYLNFWEGADRLHVQSLPVLQPDI